MVRERPGRRGPDSPAPCSSALPLPPARAQTPAAAPAAAGPAPRQGRQTPCLGLLPSPYPYTVYAPFVCNDWRFGPARLPRTGILGDILEGYDRFGALTPVEFLNNWWNPSLDSGQGDWKYPPDDGFDHDTSGNVIAAEMTLQPGQLLDRFGNEFGKFLAPAGAKYGERSIPPSNLNTEDPRYPYNYHLYRVKKTPPCAPGPQPRRSSSRARACST